MLVYSLTSILVYFSLFQYEKYKQEKLFNKENYFCKFYKIAAILILTLFFGLRAYTVGTDTINYKYIYDWLGNELIYNRMIYEKGFCFVNIIVNKVFNNFTALLIIIGFIIYFNIVNSICELSQRPSISIICYFGLGLFAQSCNLMRQYLALSFCLVALKYLIKNSNYFLFIFFVFVAFSFHKSSILFLVIPILKLFKFNLKTIILFLFISLILVVFLPLGLRIFDKILGTHYSGYLIYKEQLFSIKNIVLIFFVILSLFFLYFAKKKINNVDILKEYNFWCVIFLVYSCLIVISVFGAELADRIAIYFLISILFLIPIIICNSKYFEKKFYYIMLIMFFVILITFLFCIRGTYGFLPYKFI